MKVSNCKEVSNMNVISCMKVINFMKIIQFMPVIQFMKVIFMEVLILWNIDIHRYIYIYLSTERYKYLWTQRCENLHRDIKIIS